MTSSDVFEEKDSRGNYYYYSPRIDINCSSGYQFNARDIGAAYVYLGAVRIEGWKALTQYVYYDSGYNELYLTCNKMRAGEDCGLCVSGVQVTTGNCSDILGDGTAVYDPDAETLDLVDYDAGPIYCEHYLDIGGDNSRVTRDEYDYDYESAIYVDGDCGIYLIDNLVIEAQGECGIRIEGDLQVNYSDANRQGELWITLDGSGSGAFTVGIDVAGYLDLDPKLLRMRITNSTDNACAIYEGTGMGIGPGCTADIVVGSGGAAKPYEYVGIYAAEDEVKLTYDGRIDCTVTGSSLGENYGVQLERGAKLMFNGWGSPQSFTATVPISGGSIGGETYDRYVLTGSTSSAQAVFDYQVPGYPCWIEGIQVTEENKDDVLGDGTVWYYPGNGDNPAVLSLNNAVLAEGDDAYEVIRLEKNTIIELHGYSEIETDIMHQGIINLNSLTTFKGDGYLDITGCNTSIYTNYGFTVDGGQVGMQSTDPWYPPVGGEPAFINVFGGNLSLIGTNFSSGTDLYVEDGQVYLTNENGPALLANLILGGEEMSVLAGESRWETSIWDGVTPLSSFHYVTIGPYGAYNPFVDIRMKDYYYDPILWAFFHNPQITKGTDAAHFSPNQTCTREQVVTFLWRAAGCPEPTSTNNPFKDVRTKDYFYKPVLWAVETGVTQGIDSDRFGVNQPCTRGQVAAFLWRTAGEPEPETTENPFKDVRTKDYFYKAVLWALERNITKGTDATHFSPNEACTRGQIVTFLCRADYYIWYE